MKESKLEKTNQLINVFVELAEEQKVTLNKTEVFLADIAKSLAIIADCLTNRM